MDVNRCETSKGLGIPFIGNSTGQRLPEAANVRMPQERKGRQENQQGKP
jgi:hypothetical protein